MKTLIVYFSRSGHTRTVATALAEQLQADLEEIREPRGRRGIFGYLRSAREAMKQIPVIIEPMRDPAPYDLVIIGTPVWAASLSSPVRTYLTAHRGHLSAVAFFCTMGGHGAESVFNQMRALTTEPPSGCLAITDHHIASGAYRTLVRAFAGSLGADHDIANQHAEYTPHLSP